MKKFMFLFLVVAFVAVMAGGAMAIEDPGAIECCVPPCPPICEGDSLHINYDIYGLHCIQICEDYVELCGWVPCPGYVMTSECAPFNFSVWNTGCNGQVYAWLDQYIPGANVYVSLEGCPGDAAPEVEITPTLIDTLGFPECYDGRGGVKMKVFSVANCSCGTSTLYLRITADQPVCGE